MPFGFWLVILFSFFAGSKTSLACSQLEHDHLLSFFHNISTPKKINWSSPNCCLWEGISCDDVGRVTHLWLPFRGLRGTLSPSLANLTHLSHVNLSHNWLNGPLTNEFFTTLNRLEILDLSSNLLSSEIQSSLPFSIRVLDLSNNKFHGTIGPSLFKLASNMISYNISNNSFAGPLPSSICINSTFIQRLDFSFNDFSGQIPHGFGKCRKLEVLRAGFNSLSNLLPYDIYNATTLREISLPTNMLSGHIGDGIVQLSNLTILELCFNELIGELPRDIGKLSNLEQLNLQFNNLSGSFPPSLMNCSNLVTLNFWNNLLKGDISAFNFSKFQQLRILDLGNNAFTGNFPTTLYSCKSLTAIRLARNHLKAQVSPGMLQLQSLSFLSLSDSGIVNISGTLRILMGCKSLQTILLSRNFINEVIPDYDVVDLVGFKKLEVLTLGGCQLTGGIPYWIVKLRKLVALDLAMNNLSGSIPGWLGTLPRLFYIELSHNNLSGEFPKEICRLPSLTSDEALAQINQSYMALPLYKWPTKDGVLQYRCVCNLPRAINLGNNNLTGHIPIEIGQLQQLHVLDLSHNDFSGTIPGQISYLANLETLDLSNNHLSGEIPKSLASLNFLSQFNVSYNNLQGQIPSGSQLDLFGSSSYVGNPKLCGVPLPNACQITSGNNIHNTREVKDESNFPWFWMVVGLGYSTGFCVVCTTLLLKSSWRQAYFQFLNDINKRAFSRLLN